MDSSLLTVRVSVGDLLLPIEKMELGSYVDEINYEDKSGMQKIQSFDNA